MKFSIVIPSYNAEKYIEAAMHSLVNQTYNLKDFEVIVVDDCSNDNTVKTVKLFQSKLNLSVIQLDENSGGPGKPRNEGIKHAKGEYILFLDSDDYIAENTLENVSLFIGKHPSDIILIKMQGVNGRGVPKSMFKRTSESENLVGSRLIYTLSPTKFFKTSLLKSNNIYFPEDLKSAEDQLFTMKAYLKSSNISVLADQSYYFATKRNGEHMSSAYVHPNSFYKVMSLIVTEILQSNREDKVDLLIIFLERHFSFSRTNNFSLKVPENMIDEWMEAFGKFTDLIPEEVYQKIKPSLVPLIVYGKKRNLTMYKIIEKSYLDNKFTDIKIQDTKILAKFIEDGPYFEVTDLHNPNVKMVNFELNFDNIILEIDVERVLINANDRLSKVLLKLVSRNKKEVIYIPVTMNNGKLFRFVINFVDLIKFGVKEKIWDFFFEIDGHGFDITRRIGNKRNKYKYSKETSVLIYSNNNRYRLTPYFTKDYDNLSLYITKVDSIPQFRFKYINSKKFEILPESFKYMINDGPVNLKINNKSIYCEIQPILTDSKTPEKYLVVLDEKIKKRWLSKEMEIRSSRGNLKL